MYNVLTVRDSMYIVEEDFLNQFKELCAAIKIDANLRIRLPLTTKNHWATAFTAYCMLHEKEHELYMDPAKIMIFSSNFHGIDLLRNEKELQAFIKSQQFTPRFAFILSYCLASEITLLIREILAETEEGLIVNERNLNRDYFAMTDSADFSEEIKAEFYKDQNVFIKVLLKSISQTKQFEQSITYAISSARALLMEQSSSRGVNLT